MLKKYTNAISDFELEILQSWFNESLSATGFELKFEFNDPRYNLDKDYFKLKHTLYKKDKIYAMERTMVPAELKFKIGAMINRITGKNFNFVKNDGMYFVRVNIPSAVHIDELYREDTHISSKGFTYVLPLTFSDNISTVSWKNIYDKASDMEADKMFYLRNIKDKVTPKEYPSNIRVMLSHCIEVIDFWEFEDYATWEKGSLIEFCAGQVHCSSNFRPYHNYKDYILWHIV